MIAQLPRLVALLLAVALVSFLALNLEASPQVAASEGTSESAAVLRKAPLCIVQVEATDGKPLPNVTVVCVDPSTNAVLKGATIEGGGERFQTDVQGRFSLPWKDTNVVVMVANDKGFALAQSSDLVKSPIMIARPWGRVEGRRINRGQPVAGQSLRYSLATSFLVSKELQEIWVAGLPTVTDKEGRFVFDFVPPVDILFWGRRRHPGKYYSPLQLAEVEPGKTNWIEIATQGRTVVGQLELDPA